MLPETRGQGIASTLLTFLTTELDSQAKHETLFLEVRPSNNVAIRLYKKAGFEVYAKRPKYYRDGEDALLMRKASKKPSYKIRSI